jgi:hypothetical protein
MIALLAAALAVVPTAHAEDHLVLDATLNGVSTEATDSGASGGMALGARLDLMRFYGSLDGQAVSGDLWSGRASAGLDLLQRIDAVDLELGLFSGAGGGLSDPSVAIAPMVGAELGVGLKAGRVGLNWRHSFELASSWEEDRVRVGVDVLERTRIFGQFTRLTPGAEASARDSYGIGVALVF